MACDMMGDSCLIAVKRVAYWTSDIGRDDIVLWFWLSARLGVLCGSRATLVAFALALALSLGTRGHDIGAQVDLFRRGLEMLFLADVTILVAASPSLLLCLEVSRECGRMVLCGTASGGSLDLCGIGHALDTTYTAVGEAYLDAAGVVAAGEDVADEAGDLAPRALVCLEDDVDAGARDDLGGSGHGAGVHGGGSGDGCRGERRGWRVTCLVMCSGGIGALECMHGEVLIRLCNGSWWVHLSKV